MTIDFRNPEEAMRVQDVPAPVLAFPQRFILLAVGACSVAFFAVGWWIVWWPVSWLEPGVAPWVGLAFVLSAVGDVLAVFVLRWIWRRRAAAVG